MIKNICLNEIPTERHFVVGSWNSIKSYVYYSIWMFIFILDNIIAIIILHSKMSNELFNILRRCTNHKNDCCFWINKI